MARRCDGLCLSRERHLSTMPKREIRILHKATGVAGSIWLAAREPAAIGRRARREKIGMRGFQRFARTVRHGAGWIRSGIESIFDRGRKNRSRISFLRRRRASDAGPPVRAARCGRRMRSGASCLEGGDEACGRELQGWARCRAGRLPVEPARTVWSKTAARSRKSCG